MRPLVHLKRLTACILSLALVLGGGLVNPTVYADNTDVEQGVGFSDVEEHWAKDQVLDWSEKGLVSGYDDGTFKPEQGVTRAEFITFVNRAYGLIAKARVNFVDVSPGDWFADEVAKAVAAGYISGYDDGTMRPAAEISRLEAAVVLFRLLKLDSLNNERSIAGFHDAGSIADWGREYVNAAVAKGYFSGYPDGTFKPDRVITRAETVTLLGKATGVLYNAPGTYGPGKGDGRIAGNVTVSVSGVKLKDLVVEGDLFLTAGIGDGDFDADGIVVKGRTIVSGGGARSIVFNNTSLEEMIVAVEGGRVRVIAKGKTKIGNVVLESGAHLEEEGLTGNGFGDVQVLAVKSGESVELDGDFHKVSVKAAADLEITGDTRIKDLEVLAGARGTNINIGKNAVIETLRLKATTKVKGKGVIKVAHDDAGNSSFENEPDKLFVEGEEQEKEEKEEKRRGGGGGGTTPKAVRSVKVEQETVTLAVYESVYITATVTVTGGASKAINWESSDMSVATVSSTGKTTAEVTAVAVGTATVTATSVFDTSKSDSCAVTVKEGEEPVDPKAAFKEELKDAVAAEVSKVAEVEIGEEDNDDITVTFLRNEEGEVDISAIETAANALIDALIELVDEGNLTLTLNDEEEGRTFELAEGIAGEVAGYLLDGDTAAGFIENGEVTATYKAEITVEGVPFELNGDLLFQMEEVEEPVTPEAAKAAFMAALAEAVEDIDVVEVGINEDDITVTFNAPSEEEDFINSVHEAAEALFKSLIGEEGGYDLKELTLKLDGNEEGFKYPEDENGDSKELDLVDVAKYLLSALTSEEGGTAAAEAFLNGEEAVVAQYTVELSKHEVEFKLEGELVFQTEAIADSEAAKADFMESLEVQVDDLNVASVVLDGEDITVTFNAPSEEEDFINSVHEAAEALFKSLIGEEGGYDLKELTLKLDGNEEGFKYPEDENGDSKELDLVDVAKYLLSALTSEEGGTAAAEAFLNGEEAVVAQYTVELSKHEVEFKLEGELVFQTEAIADSEAAKADFLDGLKTAVSSDVATVEIDGESVSVTFAHDATVDGIKDAADALVGELLKDGVTGTLTIGGEEFDLEDEEVATAVAGAILEGTAEDFLDEGSAEVEYTATVTVDGVEFTLEGELSFKMEDAQ